MPSFPHIASIEVDYSEQPLTALRVEMCMVRQLVTSLSHSGNERPRLAVHSNRGEWLVRAVVSTGRSERLVPALQTVQTSS